MLKHPGTHILGWILAFFFADYLFGWVPKLPIPEVITETFGIVTLVICIALLLRNIIVQQRTS